MQAGDITRYMAVPWQADFYECNTDWWPAQRPDDVVPQSEYHKLLGTWNPNNQQQDTVAQLLAARKSWARGLGEQIDAQLPSPGDNDMVDKWSGLGFVVTQQAPAGETILVEIERTPYLGLNQREYFYKLMNIQAHPEFIPRARSLATEFLKQAWDLQNHPDFPSTLLFFPYGKEAFRNRMTTIYEDLVDQTEAYNPIDDPVFKTRADLLQRVYQFAPFNLLDGAWLRNTTQAGPINKIHALLFAIWMDEVGDGQVELNHCNLYNDLLHSVGIYLEPINSRDFAYNPNMLDSAYTVPLFELAISQWAQDFFPEILGMTLQLEWEVVSLKPTIKLFDYLGISPHFYSMHVGIDNATEGHGAKAKEAVEEYLDQVFEGGGEEAVQKQWQRIWNGYIAFSQTGTLGNDLANLIANPLTLDDQVTEMMLRKKPYAELNHGDKKLGANYINDWFEDTEGFKQELLASGLMIPGDPDNSPFFNLLSFTGPMYKVFTDDEIKLWRDWIRSKGAKPTPPSPIDPATAMVDLIDTLRQRQAETVGHQDHVLIGPDPNNPDAQITRPVAWWFTQKSTDLMRTVANEENGLIDKGNPENSAFVTDLLSPANAMGQAFTAIIPNTGDQTARDIAIKWITAGCPIPGEPSVARPRLTLASFALAASQQNGRARDSSGHRAGISSLLPGRLFGMGTVH